MGYLVYYLPFIALWIGTSYPEVLLGAIVVLVLQRYLPDPVLWLRHQSRLRALRADIAQNPDNVTARRDLAVIWLDRRRPARALPILAEAARREPDSPELLYLIGRALLLSGRPQEALDPLVKAIAQQERMHYGEGYLLCARALLQLGRHAEAEDALRRFLRINRSSVEGHVRLGRARKAQGDAAGARAARTEARETFAQLPRFLRRKQLGWYLRALLP